MNQQQSGFSLWICGMIDTCEPGKTQSSASGKSALSVKGEYDVSMAEN